MEISKQQVEVYTIRTGNDWGQIALVISDPTVNVMANSSYGKYAYFWGACGCHPKEFLCKINRGYALQKMYGNKYLVPDSDKYEEEIKKAIIEARRERDLEPGEARHAWGSMLGILYDYGGGDAMAHELINHEYFEKVFGSYDRLPSATMINPQCQGFWDKIWLPFVAELKTEMATQ